MTNRTKDQVASGYMEECKFQYGWKHRPSPKERIAIVGGACKETRNIGYSVALKLAKSFGRVVCIDPRAKNGQQDNIVFQRDLIFDPMTHTDHLYINGMMPQTLVLANGQTELNWIEHTDMETAENILQNCLMASIEATVRFVTATMPLPYRKSIIYIGSMAHSRVLNGSSVYCAAKAGLAHYARCAAWELAPKGFDVYIVHPSNVEAAPMSEKTTTDLMRYRNMNLQEAYNYWSAGNPREFPLSKDEIAELVHDLAIGKYPYLAGTQIDMAGGMR